jgi:hypothetical protein
MDFFEPGYAHREGAETTLPADRRRHDRLSDCLPLQVGGLAARVHDISRRGICLILEEPVAGGDRYRLSLKDTLDGSSVSIEGEVVWSVNDRAGLRWVELSKEQDRWLFQRFTVWLEELRDA